MPPGTMILRVAWVTAVIGSVACSSRSLADRDGGPGGLDAVISGDARADDHAGNVAGDASTTGDSATDARPSPPLDLPGIVLWLDGDVGIEAPASPGMTWTDRSAYGHVFVGQASQGDMPAMAQLNGHGAVRFNGHNRFISEHTPNPGQLGALSLGGNFVIALVFVPEQEADGGTVVTLAMLPWIPSPISADFVIPPSTPPSFVVAAGLGPTRVFQAGASKLNVGGGFPLSPQRLILSTEGGNPVRVRLNGQLQTGTPAAVDRYDGAYAPIFVGSWDFDSSGFEGTVAEMVIVRGGADPATEEALDSYLKGKFSL